MLRGSEQVTERGRGPAPSPLAPTALRGRSPAAPGSFERQLGNNAVAVRDGDRVPASSPNPAEQQASAAERRQRAHKLVAAVQDLLRQYVKNVATTSAGWHELDSPRQIQGKCEAALHYVSHVEVSLANGSPVTGKELGDAVGSMRIAERYLERLIGQGGKERAEASIRALERAATLVPLPAGPPIPVPRPAGLPKPLSTGWHRIVGDDGKPVGYVEVRSSWLRNYYDEDLEFRYGEETPIESEGIGPLEYLPIAAGLSKAVFKLGAAAAGAILRSAAARSARRAAAGIGAAVMTGVAEAAPVVAGRAAPQAFILSEALTGDVAIAEARAASRSVGTKAVAAAETEAATAGSTTTTTTTTARRYAASLGEQAEGPNLRKYHPDARSVPPKFRAYDAFEGGTIADELTREKSGKKWILVVNQTIRDATWISLKQVLDVKDATPANIGKLIDKALLDMERDHTDQLARKPSRDPEPVAENVYLRVYKDRPKAVMLDVTYPGPLPAEQERAIEEAARQTVARSADRVKGLPSFTLMLNGKTIPLY